MGHEGTFKWLEDLMFNERLGAFDLVDRALGLIKGSGARFPLMVVCKSAG